MRLFPYILYLVVRLSFGADVSVELTAERTQITLEDQLELQVSVRGSRENANPEILNADDFEVQQSGTSSQVQVINGSVSQQIVFGFVLTPKNPGKFKVGPARVTVGGKQYESAPLEVTVGKSAPATAGQDRFFYVTSEVDNKSPFVNQQVNYTFKFFNRAELANAQLGLPEFKGFLKEGPDKQKETEQIISGVRWSVTTLRFALFPTAPGTLQIEPARLGADAVLRSHRDSFFEDFFAGARTKRVNLRSEPIQIVVSPLPSQARPAEFSGLVGEFNLSASLGKQALSVGDSTTLTLTLEGDGNLREFSLPDSQSSDFKLYDDQPAFDIRSTAKGWIGTKTFKRALVPLKAGELPITPLKIGYFDPKARAYKFLETKPLKITASGQLADDAVHHVAPSEEVASKRKIEVVGKDLMPIKRSPSSLKSDSLSSMERTILLGICFFCPLAFGALLTFKKRKDRLSTDTGLLRKRKAYRDFRSRVKHLNTDGAFYQEASLLLREYLGNKFNLDGKALTPTDAEKKLAARRVSKDTVKKVENFLRECEAGQYGGESHGDHSSHQERLVSLVESIEKEVR